MHRTSATDRQPRRRDGFTLIELAIAMVVTGMALVAGGMLMRQVTDVRDRAAIEATTASTTINGERLLRATLRNARAPRDSTESFVGDPLDASVPSWCAVSEGWLERCTIRLLLERSGDSTVVLIQLPSSGQMRVAARPGIWSLAYFNLENTDSAWAPRWGTSLVLPAVMALVTQNDTVPFEIGGAK